MNDQTSLPTKRRACILRLGLVAALAVLAVAALSWGLGSTASAETEQVAVGLICDAAGLTGFGDMGFNWLSYQGLLRAEAELGVVGTVYTPTDPSLYPAAVQQCADDGNDLCIGVGFMLAEAVWNAAQANPGTDFAVIDSTWNDYPDNLRGLAFAEDEAGYLAGILAGMMTESDVIGDIGGMPIPPVERFVYGYRNGARCANPDVDVLIDYTWDFADPELGAQFAQDMIAQGADVIFAPAGGTAIGAVLTATQSDVYGIGVDTDFYYTVFLTGTVDGADRLLSSAMKRLDNAVFLTIQDVVSGTFSSGTVLYDLAVDGVGLAPFHETDPLIPQSVRDALETARLGIIAGTVDVNDPCWGYTRYVDGASGSDDSDCTDPTDPCQSVGYALGQSQHDDRILVARGDYTDNLWVDRRVTLEGGYAGPPDWPRDLGQYETTLRSGSVTFPGDWDGSGVFAPMVISDDGEYRLWYVGYDLYGFGSAYLGLATSPDGVAWDKSASNPLLRSEEAWVTRQGPSDYVMWHNGGDSRIYRAVSSDGVNWAHDPADPVLEPTYQEDSWERDYVSDPSIIQDDDGTYWMFYEGGNWNWNVVQIGVATSTNGIDWTRVQTTPALGVGGAGDWDETWVLDPMVIYEPGLFRMWYSAFDANWVRQIGYATSTDGIHWTRDIANNPVFSPDPGRWDDGNVGNHFVLHDSDYWMWYTSNWRVGVVTSTDGLTWNRFLPDPVLTPGLHGQWGQPVVEFADGSSGAVLDGFTVTGGDSDSGAGLRIGGQGSAASQPGFAYEASTCLTPPLGLAVTEAITITVEGNDVVMSHTDVIYNCCAVMVVDFENQSPLLRLIERETYPDGGPCYCLCPYNLSARISDLPPGEYEVEVWDEPNNRLVISVPVTIPGRARGSVSPQALEDILVANCVITGNQAYYWGGGVWIADAYVTIRDSLIADNRANAGGAGITVNGDWGPAHLEMSGSTLSGNVAALNGGGMHVWNVIAALDRVVFYNNVAGQAGGGLNVEQGALVQVQASDFFSNTAFWGGGLHVRNNAAAVMDSCWVRGNVATDSGGGMRLLDGSLLTMTNSLVVGNHVPRDESFAGIEFAMPASGGFLMNVTVADNDVPSGAGIRHADPEWPLTMVNAIVYGNAGEQLRCEGDGGCDVSYSNVEGGWSGVGNIAVDPLFVGVGDYHLQASSPCVDSGTNTGAPAKDFEGDRRPLDGDVDGVAITDMGADEYAPPMIFLPVVLRNG